MSRRTQLYSQVPWVGGWNTATDPGMLNPQELVKADNVQYTTTGARIKREALEYLDEAVPAPDFRSSSGTTRTLKWTTNALVNITSPNERLVVGEKINVSGVTNYAATDASILTRTSIPQVTLITCVADVSNSLRGKYFYISAGDSGTNYYVWYKVSGGGSDPAISGKTGIEVDISTNATANTVASTTATAIAALSTDFASATPSSANITVTNAKGGLTTDGSAQTSGFTVSVSTKGGHSITYTANAALSESSTAAGGITVDRASAVIMYHDYWRFADDSTDQQIGVFATDDFQLFTLDDSSRRVQIHGQEHTSQVICTAGSTITAGHYFLVDGPQGGTDYYVWYKVDATGSDPAVSSRTGIEVDIASGDTAAQVATKTNTAINAANAQFTSSRDTATLTLTNTSAGTSAGAVDVNSGFAFSVVAYGATNPVTAVETIRTNVFNELLFITMSGLGNKPISYNPDVNTKYQLADPNMPDASFCFNHQSRIWCNDKTTRDRLHFCETFDQTQWLGLGDSGAIDFIPGDGDPEGVTNAYSYKGMIIAAKKVHRYRMTGDSPENYYVEEISKGMGNEGALAVGLDDIDVIFASAKGFHSQEVTDQYGDVASTYISADIKPTFVESEAADRKLIQGAYIPDLNSAAFSMTESGEQSQVDVWLFNPEIQVPGKQRPGAWYRWPNISCTALSRRFTAGTYKLVFGTNDGRVTQAQTPHDFADFGTDGIEFNIKSGAIYPNNDPHSIKAFKKISMIYRPRGNFSFTVKATIDNQKAQSFGFNQVSGLDLLGETFILGQSLLGSSATLAPFSFSMEGYGRGITLEVSQPTANEQVEIWGFIIEYEQADVAQETDV